MNKEEAIEILKDSYERLAMLAHGGLYPDEREELRKAFEALLTSSPTPSPAWCRANTAPTLLIKNPCSKRINTSRTPA